MHEIPSQAAESVDADLYPVRSQMQEPSSMGIWSAASNIGPDERPVSKSVPVGTQAPPPNPTSRSPRSGEALRRAARRQRNDIPTSV